MQLSICGSRACREISVERQQPRGLGGVFGGGEDMGRCLTDIVESLGFVLGFRVNT
jgi:hypothetical protein